MADREKPRLHVEFFTRPVENPKKSKEAGRPIFEDKEFVRIRIPGDRNRTHEAPATERALREPGTNEWLSYIDRFPEHYKAFKNGQTYIGDGTPLAELPFLTESKRAELRALNIHTAEVLAALDGTPLKQLGMHGRELKDQAQAWLDKAKGSADVTRLAAENASLREMMENMQRQMAELAAGNRRPPTMTATAGGTTVTTVVGDGSPFQAMTVDEIKGYIAEKTGAKPRGNPSHATLVNMADEINAQAQAA